MSSVPARKRHLRVGVMESKAIAGLMPVGIAQTKPYECQECFYRTLQQEHNEENKKKHMKPIDLTYRI